ncbi:hypothetical protein C3L33_20905, partial [Rhododendron williamsianum]
MASPTPELLFDLPNFMRIYKDGTVERFIGTEIVPASTDPTTGVRSKDAVIDQETGVSARIYIPKTTANPNNKKLPLLVYFHGGGFCFETAVSPTYHHHLNSLAAEANVVVVSVDYRRAPEHPLPAAYDDSWAASRDSAGANIAHHMGIRVGSENPDGFKLAGIALIHPYFGGEEPIGGERDNAAGKAMGDKLWLIACPTSSGPDDPLFNPGKDPNISKMGCGKVLVCVGEKDVLRDRGWYYKEELVKSGWGGVVEVMEAEGENHVFHLINPTCDNAVAMLKRLAAFMN